MDKQTVLSTNVNTPTVKMGSIAREWRSGEAKNITLSLTQECNLRCTYCYMTHKNNTHRMSLDMAKKVVDYILINRDFFDSPAVIWEFIGGEPLIEIDLVDQISEYIKIRMYSLDHPWKDNYVFFMCTNGLLYSTPKVQEYIKKNRTHISIGMSVDGNKAKHDLSRIKPDGSGSYDDVIKNVPLWLEQFPGSMTKATFAHADLPYLRDSIISLWNNGIKTVAANVVFEDVWDEQDPEIFENQLKQLADYVIENKLWDEFSVRFFTPSNGFALDAGSLKRPYCGSGRMLAVDDKGSFYPCIRFLDFCQNNNKVRTIGNVYEGINRDKLRPFYGITIAAQSTEKCINCEVASGCANCTGNDFDCSSCGTIFHKATHICEMHKASVRANKYFWWKYSECSGKISERDVYLSKLLKNPEWTKKFGKFLYFITSDSITPHCQYSAYGSKIMSDSIFQKGIKFCYENDYVPVFLGRHNPKVDKYLENHIGFVFDAPNKIKSNTVDIYTAEQLFELDSNKDSSIAILNITCADISTLDVNLTLLSHKYKRINLNIIDVNTMDSMCQSVYKEQLNNLIQLIIKKIKEDGVFLEINVLTDLLYNDFLIDCKAGKNSLALSPTGEIYPCPAFYFSDRAKIGNIEDRYCDISAKFYEYRLPLCEQCDASHCKVCRYINLDMTGEFNYPPKVQCEISHIEREASVQLAEILIKEKLKHIKHHLVSHGYSDPQELNTFTMGRIVESYVGKGEDKTGSC